MLSVRKGKNCMGVASSSTMYTSKRFSLDIGVETCLRKATYCYTSISHFFLNSLFPTTLNFWDGINDLEFESYFTLPLIKNLFNVVSPIYWRRVWAHIKSGKGGIWTQVLFVRDMLLSHKSWHMMGLLGEWLSD